MVITYSFFFLFGWLFVAQGQCPIALADLLYRIRSIPSKTKIYEHFFLYFTGTCEDHSTADCPLLDSLTSVCQNYSLGKVFCRKYCGFCNRSKTLSESEK